MPSAAERRAGASGGELGGSVRAVSSFQLPPGRSLQVAPPQLGTGANPALSVPGMSPRAGSLQVPPMRATMPPSPRRRLQAAPAGAITAAGPQVAPAPKAAQAMTPVVPPPTESPGLHGAAVSTRSGVSSSSGFASATRSSHVLPAARREASPAPARPANLGLRALGPSMPAAASPAAVVAPVAQVGPPWTWPVEPTQAPVRPFMVPNNGPGALRAGSPIAALQRAASPQPLAVAAAAPGRGAAAASASRSRSAAPASRVGSMALPLGGALNATWRRPVVPAVASQPSEDEQASNAGNAAKSAAWPFAKVSANDATAAPIVGPAIIFMPAGRGGAALQSPVPGTRGCPGQGQAMAPSGCMSAGGCTSPRATLRAQLGAESHPGSVRVPQGAEALQGSIRSHAGADSTRSGARAPAGARTSQGSVQLPMGAASPSGLARSCADNGLTRHGGGAVAPEVASSKAEADRARATGKTNGPVHGLNGFDSGNDLTGAFLRTWAATGTAGGQVQGMQALREMPHAASLSPRPAAFAAAWSGSAGPQPPPPAPFLNGIAASGPAGGAGAVAAA
eukprot:TRINITY_DN64204_c0_g1_i1.p1 TRINITY_DN64204_c0_g1~~TRINITY_DN64204_c0_g1_i1.p1  ORF type:complete len:606 (+),score=112.33 TRINITY_DN64204_c0_g1_i1:121-1818(+)